MASQSPTPIEHSFDTVLSSARNWWNTEVIGQVDHKAVIEQRRGDCDLTGRYVFMTLMSAGIAVLGLLLSSPAVVIGAMLLSPLMDPIIGLGMALAIGDFNWMKTSAKSLLLGTVLGIGFCAMIVFLSPLQTITPEIAARTQPNLFDLFVALFSGLAGAYALIKGRQGTVVGVAIATALMPPLAVIGFGLATFNSTVFWGATLLYVTNFVVIAITATVMSKLYGFRTLLDQRYTMFQNIGIVFTLVALAIPLMISLQQIAWETRANRAINSEILDALSDNAQISNMNVEFGTEPIQVSATVWTPKITPNAEQVAARELQEQFDLPFDVSITQVLTGSGAQSVEQAALASARAEEEANFRRAEQLAERLALVAGVPVAEVLVDRERKTALVNARPLDGASLAAYRELEARIASNEPGWTIKLRPPARDLPPVPFGDEGPSTGGAAAIGLIEWAAKRVNVPVVLSGSADNVEALSELLTQRGVTVQAEPNGGSDVVNVTWGTPE